MFKLPPTPWPGSAVPPGALPTSTTSHKCNNSANNKQRSSESWLPLGSGQAVEDQLESGQGAKVGTSVFMEAATS